MPKENYWNIFCKILLLQIKQRENCICMSIGQRRRYFQTISFIVFSQIVHILVVPLIVMRKVQDLTSFYTISIICFLLYSLSNYLYLVILRFYRCSKYCMQRLTLIFFTIKFTHECCYQILIHEIFCSKCIDLKWSNCVSFFFVL